MICFLIASIMVISYLDFKLISAILKRNVTYFEEHKKYGKGEVVGYDASEGSRWYSLIIKIIDLNDNKTYICSSAKIDIHDYPKGSIVNVIYAVTKRGRVRVHLADKLPANENNMAKVFNIVSWISLIFAFIFVLAGVLTIIL